jgi:hypothetical protein
MQVVVFPSPGRALVITSVRIGRVRRIDWMRARRLRYCSLMGESESLSTSRARLPARSSCARFRRERTRGAAGRSRISRADVGPPGGAPHSARCVSALWSAS